MNKWTILIPTDFSANAKNAVDYACQLMQDENCEFILHHSWLNVPVGEPILHELDEILSQQKHQLLEEESARIKSKFGLVDITINEKKGELTSNIEELNRFYSIDFIIMGTQGANRIRKRIFGSNTTAVIQMSKCPVLSVPESYPFEKPDRIALCSDFKHIYDKNIFNVLNFISKKHQSKIKILHILNKGEISSREEAKEALSLNNLISEIPHTYHFIADPKIDDGIDLFTKQEQINLLCMISKTDNFFNYYFNNSQTKKVALKIEVPLLSLHDNNQVL